MKPVIDSENFDNKLSRLLSVKRGKNVIRGRFDIEEASIDEKNNFITSLILQSGSITNLTYKISFWNDNKVIEDLMNSTSKNFNITTKYKNKDESGICFVDETSLDPAFLNNLLTNHFNYELGKDPSLNIRVQICASYPKLNILFDIYDDRGFDIYYLTLA